MFASRFRCSRAVAAAAAAASASGVGESQQETMWCDTWQEEQGDAFEETCGDAFEETCGDDELEQADVEEQDHQDEQDNEAVDEALRACGTVRFDLQAEEDELEALDEAEEEQEALPSSSSAILSGWSHALEALEEEVLPSSSSAILSIQSHAQQHSPPTARQRPQLAGRIYQRRQLSPESELEPRKESQLHDGQPFCRRCASRHTDEQPFCRRCASRHKLAAVRLGPPVTPHRPLDVNRPVPQPVPSTPSTPSRPPRFCSPVPRPQAQLGRDASQEGGQQPEACSRSQSASKISQTPPKEWPETCECLVGTLAQFSERLQGFLLAFMGFHHPHKDRLRAAVDQQVDTLGSGLTSLLFAQKAFFGLRSRAREAGLWNKLREYRQQLLKTRQELQEAREIAYQESALRRHVQNVSRAAKDRKTDAKAAAARILCRRPCGSEMLLMRCLAAWQRYAAAKSSARKSARSSVMIALASQEASMPRLVFAKWQQVVMASRHDMEVAALGDAASQEMSQQIDNAKAAAAAALIASSSRCDQTRSAFCFMAWNKAAVNSRCQKLHASVQDSEQRVAEQADNLLQFKKYFGQRPHSEAGSDAFCLKAILMSWAREADKTARRRHILEATLRVATRAAELLHDRVTSNILRGCISAWARSSREQQAAGLQTESQKMPRAPSTDSRSPKTSASLHLPQRRISVPCGTTPRTFVQQPTMHRSATLRIEKDRPPLRQDAKVGEACFLGSSKRKKSFQKLEEGLIPSDAMDNIRLEIHETMPCSWQDEDAPIDVSSLHEPGEWLPSDAMKHYCLARRASQSEDGYKELLEYHRQTGRASRSGIDGARNFGQVQA